MKTLFLFVAALFTASFAAALMGSLHRPPPRRNGVGCAAAQSPLPPPAPQSRAAFLSTAFLAACATLPPSSASWAATDGDRKGTKKDPVYESCLSKCMYTCTKPKGVEQKSRSECLPACKVQCATTKEQLLKGTPIKS